MRAGAWGSVVAAAALVAAGAARTASAAIQIGLLSDLHVGEGCPSPYNGTCFQPRYHRCHLCCHHRAYRHLFDAQALTTATA